MHRASCSILGKQIRMLTRWYPLPKWISYSLTLAFSGLPFLNLKALNIKILKRHCILFLRVCFTAAPREERGHSCILEASLWKFEGCEGPRPARMYWFTTAETGEQHVQLPAHSHTPSAECKKQSQWQTKCKQAHKAPSSKHFFVFFFLSKELYSSRLKITIDLAAKEKT